MTFKTGEITVDLMNDVHTKEINFFQGDQNSAKLILNVTNRGEELNLSEDTVVRITFKKPDGTTVFQEDLQPINAIKRKYQIVLKTQTLAVVGYVTGQVHITEGDSNLDSKRFGFTVKKSLASDDTIESTNEFMIIKKVLEVGEKFEGVDFDPIIAAGEIAEEAKKVTEQNTTQIGDLSKKVNTESLRKRPLVSLIFDDGWIQDYTLIKALLKARNVKGVVALISDIVKQNSNPDSCLHNKNYMTPAQIDTLVADGWDMVPTQKLIRN